MNIYKAPGVFKYLAGDMLPNTDMTLTIRSVTTEIVGTPRGNEEKTLIGFRETRKPLILIPTNARTLVRLFGPETDTWIGKRITVYTETIRPGGIETRAIRIRPKPAPALTSAQLAQEAEALKSQGEQLNRDLIG